MGSPNRTNSINNEYLGTAAAVKILSADVNRTYICFHAVSGDCKIRIGSTGTFADNHILLPEGVMWEPRVTLTGEVWFLGDGSKLTVLY